MANILRTDGIVQKPSYDKNAPNIADDGRVKEGSVKFIYSAEDDLNNVRDYLGWNFSDSKETKELNLTHNLIAGKAGFKEIMDVYDKDQILAYRNRIKKYITDYEVNEDFSQKTFGEVIEILSRGKTDRELNRVLPTVVSIYKNKI